MNGGWYSDDDDELVTAGVTLRGAGVLLIARGWCGVQGNRHRAGG